jgi:hypothetical protein
MVTFLLFCLLGVHVSFSPLKTTQEPGWLSRCSDWLRAGRPRVRSSSSGKVKNILFSTTSTQTFIQWVPRALSPEVKRPGREADHATPISAEVKKIWLYISTPTYAFKAQCLIKHSDNFTLKGNTITRSSEPLFWTIPVIFRVLLPAALQIPCLCSGPRRDTRNIYSNVKNAGPIIFLIGPIIFLICSERLFSE